MAGKYAVGGMTAPALFNLLKPNYALAGQVSFTDPDIHAEYIRYPSPEGHGEVRGYLVMPTKPTVKPASVIVVHENRGLNPYIEDVARRVAKAGYIALAPDGLSSVGGYPGNDDEGRELQQKVDPQKLMNDFCRRRLYGKASAGERQSGNNRFCYGGGVCNAAAVAILELACAVPFYGRQPPIADVEKSVRRCCCTMRSWISPSRTVGPPMNRR